MFVQILVFFIFFFFICGLSERDPESLTLGLLRAFDDRLDDDILLRVYECILDANKLCNSYIFNHIKQIIKLCILRKIQNVEIFIKFGIGHPLISPNELLKLMQQHRDKPLIDQLNLLSALQLKYEQNQLFLGRYLLYCPFQTKAVYESGKYDDYKLDQDEVEFYEEGDGDVDDETAMLIEITIDIDDIVTNEKQATIKKCLCVKNNETTEYQPDHYYEDEIVHEWEVMDYAEKILRINHTRCQWIPNLNNVSKINPSFSAIDSNPDDLNNELRGYLVLLPDDDGILSFVNDLFKKWKGNLDNNKYTECIHRMQERPLFVSMEKWKLIDMD